MVILVKLEDEFTDEAYRKTIRHLRELANKRTIIMTRAVVDRNADFKWYAQKRFIVPCDYFPKVRPYQDTYTLWLCKLIQVWRRLKLDIWVVVRGERYDHHIDNYVSDIITAY